MERSVLDWERLECEAKAWEEGDSIKLYSRAKNGWEEALGERGRGVDPKVERGWELCFALRGPRWGGDIEDQTRAWDEC